VIIYYYDDVFKEIFLENSVLSFSFRFVSRFFRFLSSFQFIIHSIFLSLFISYFHLYYKYVSSVNFHFFITQFVHMFSIHKIAHMLITAQVQIPAKQYL
jgi:hypothetical protein